VKTAQCKACGDQVAARSLTRHLSRCLPTNGGSQGFLIALKGRDDDRYLLYLAVSKDVRLSDIDSLLRQIWLECCGHSSGFTFFGQSYDTFAEDAGTYEGEDSKSLETPLFKAAPPGTSGTYIYDYGSSTELTVKVHQLRPDVKGRRQVKIVARNAPITTPCSQCGKDATQVCSQCIYSEPTEAFRCDKCAKPHEGCDDDVYLPVTDSPRNGICAYGSM
jgi:hypothetical protein